MTSDDAEDNPSSYSRAYENMVTQGPDDIVGLLAYALFKQNIAEDAGQGIKGEGHRRNPTKVTVALFRSAAEAKLNEFAAKSIDEAKSEIQASAYKSSLEEGMESLSREIVRNAGTGRAILTNLIAWLVTLAITVLVALSLSTDVQESLIKGAQSLLPSERETQDLTPAPRQ